jgi:hypothetical protein
LTGRARVVARLYFKRGAANAAPLRATHGAGDDKSLQLRACGILLAPERTTNKVSP